MNNLMLTDFCDLMIKLASRWVVKVMRGAMQFNDLNLSKQMSQGYEWDKGQATT